MKQLLLPLLLMGFYFPALSQDDKAGAEFKQAIHLNWKLSFEDDCTKDWQKNWVMDGEQSYITHSNKGMDYFAGLVAHNDTGHTVLWTKQEFSGDIRVEYDYTRLDSSTVGVNIIYLLASGSGIGAYKKDLFHWNELRRVPAMRVYFNHLNTYHISYAVNGNGSIEPDYIRARRYMPETGKGLEGTTLSPEYLEPGMFEVGVLHRITVIRRGSNLYMQAAGPTQTKVFWFDTGNYPSLTSGRIGLRQMWTRAARYANFKVFELK